MVSKILDDYANTVLSPTFQSSQLHTPRHLSRITIDDSKYQGYRAGSVGSLSSREGTATQLDDKIWGRRHGYGGIGTRTRTEPEPVVLGSEFPRSHKHFISGVQPQPRTYSSQQLYTPLDLDNIRTNQYQVKEIQAPFPAEHPFYSHTPRFSLFPAIQSCDAPTDTRPSSAGSTQGLERRLASARPPSGNPEYSQAGASVYPDPRLRAPPPIVLSKSKGQGIRRELSASRRVRSAAETWELDDVINRSDGNLVWDVPRSARHERLSTYPSPRLIFEGQNSWSRHAPVSARTNHVLENLQRSYLQTTYQRQFTGVGPQGEAKLDDYVPGYRPYSAERGSASSTRSHLPSAGYYRAVPWEGRYSASAAHLLRQSHTSVGTDKTGQEVSSDEDTPEKLSSRRVSFRNRSNSQSDSLQLTSPVNPDIPTVTQHIYDPEEPTIDTERNAPLDAPTQSPMSLKSSLKRVQISDRPSSAPSEPILSSARTPRTITSSKRLMDAYTFNRSNIRKNFDYTYPETSPDLRDLIRYPSAKRHTIHDIHSYYFH